MNKQQLLLVHFLCSFLFLVLSGRALYAQTVIGIDTLKIQSSTGTSSLIPQADTNVALKLPKSSGIIALESNGITRAASTGSAIVYVGDTTIIGGDWVTVAEIKVDSGKGGILEFSYGASYAQDPVRFVFCNYAYVQPIQSAYGVAYPGNCDVNKLTCSPNPPLQCLPGMDDRTFDRSGFLVAPYMAKIETTCAGVLLEQEAFMRGLLYFTFQQRAQTAANLDLQNNYQLALGLSPNGVSSTAYRNRYLLLPAQSGVVRLKFKNYRGQVSRGVGTVNNCCDNVMVNVASTLRLQQLILMLY